MLNFEGLEIQKWNIPPNAKTVIDFFVPTAKNKENEPFLHSSDYKCVSKHDNDTNDPILFLHLKTFKV